MSFVFRKPKKIQRRMFCADDDEDGEPEAPPPPVISQEKEKEKKEVKSVKSTTLLSFADEEEEGEVFKVKKSSQSKRLAKKREKEKQKNVRTDGDSNKYESSMLEEKNNHTEENNEKPKPGKKKITLEGLILSGREALAADGAGDVSDDSAGADEEAEEDERGFHRYRAESVRAALLGAPGRIPDAALIHAARKTRQQARELGGDYIPVKPSESGPGSRLVRDDGSGDDEEEGRILVRGLDLPSDKPKRGTAAVSEEELDSEAEEWEEQQLQKARPVIADLTGESVMDVNPFAVALPAPQMSAPEHLRPLTTSGTQPPSTANELVDALKKRLEELQVERDITSNTQKELKERLLTSARIRESRASRCGELDAAYRRAQAIRGYLTDLIECLDEKLPQLEALEARALALHKRRCEFLIERRRADLRDQAQDVLAPPGRATKGTENEEKTRRAAEREGRRRARRLRREACAAAAGALIPHRDGDSSDDDLPPHQLHHHAHERESIRAASSLVFSDALSAWRSAAGVVGRLAGWRARSPALYADAYVADCLPKLIAPYVRHELILWNPLADEDNEDYEKMDWYKSLMMYGVRSERSGQDSSESASDGEVEPVPVTEAAVREDPDLMLVPTIISRVVLPKLTELVSSAWDPMCVRACVRLRALVLRGARVPGAGPALRRLAAAIRARLSQALAADVFLPTLPPAILEGSGAVFWRRCLGAGVRLLRAALCLAAPPALLRADPLVLALIETLCTGAGAAGGAQQARAAAATLPRAPPALAATLPRAPHHLRTLALRRLARLAALALQRLDADNPLHLKAIEQARAVIAEARAVE
ncbi:LOW QUALITY PROTEIN: PAX3- and PAX7-binding protein 1 [Spodoptera litura]|uniref:LOW QUALITY PROTEIN: PAX3- and PAX7-binding protein 1 n=1 Tax=Spodoptera litura TaxID=69820 RepID=A0A9J7E1N8_SPOLT|nr:LOW QUALITY PROTEIN: PAX3- and PAX7-binding protein 1 [Spodoptera litura]